MPAQRVPLEPQWQTVILPNGIVTEDTYDAASQLTGLTYKRGQTTLGDLTYTYDLNGNRVAVGGTFARTALPQATTTPETGASLIVEWAASRTS